tara:strand:+ start:3352 stop:4323 length:972 start_codon:yes stop_codon:yes gene_type:complete
MAIYPRTQIPKWQAPIRITRPYIKPNYLADTITSAIQGYGSIQNMNMQQQLFNAKLAQQQKQQERYDATQSALQSLYTNQGVPVANAPPAVPNALDDHLPTVNPYGTTTPSPMESVRAAMQANPGADMGSIMKMAAAINAMQNPTVKGGPTNWQRYMMGRHADADLRRKGKQASDLKDDITGILRDEFGSLLKGTEEEIAARFEPSTKPIYGERSWDRPETWGLGKRQIGEVTTEDPGPIRLKEFVGRRLRDVATWMLNNGYDESDVRIMMARVKEAGMTSGKFNFIAAWGAIPSEIVEGMGSAGGQQSVSQRAAGHNVTLRN